MPTYEYVCRTCGYEMEAFQSMKDDPLTDCPECGRSALKRLIGRGAGIIFKGSGFYETDYKSNGKKPEKESADSKKQESAESPKKESSSTDNAKSSSDSKGESKPAARKESAAPAKKD